MNQKHCKFCGKVIDSDSRYCAYCGGNLENLVSIDQPQFSVQNDTQKVENDSSIEAVETEFSITDQYFTIGLVSFLIFVFWAFVNRYIETAYQYSEIWKIISIITISAIPILCVIFTKKQSYRIVLGVMAGITILYYIFIYYIEN